MGCKDGEKGKGEKISDVYGNQGKQEEREKWQRI